MTDIIYVIDAVKRLRANLDILHGDLLCHMSYDPDRVTKHLTRVTLDLEEVKDGITAVLMEQAGHVRT